MILWNARGLNPKSNQTKVPYLGELSLEDEALFILVTESQLSEDILEAEVHIKDYTIYRTDRGNDRSGGGVCIYVQDRFPCSVLHTESNSVCETLIIKVTPLNLVLCLIYRPPDCKQYEFLPCVAKIKQTLSENADSKILLMGDMNFPTINWTDTQNPKIPLSSENSDIKIQINALLELTDEYLLNQLISEPTRGENTLDLAFSNVTRDLIDCSITKCPMMSDHNIIEMWIPTLEKDKIPSTISPVLENTQPELSDLNFYKSDWTKIQNKLSSVNWNEIMENKDADDMLSTMMTAVKEIVTQHTPLRRKNIKKGKSSFFKERRALWRQRRRLVKKLNLCQNTEHKDTIQDNIDKINCSIKKSFESELIEHENKAIDKIISNPKYFFTYSKQKLQTHSKIGPLRKDSKLISDPAEKAECLQEQFCSVFSSADQTQIIEDIDDFFSSDNETTEINDIDFTEEDIEKMISEIKSTSACGEDGFSALLLKNCKTELSTPLYLLWRHSMDSGEIPSFLKISKIAPIHKGSLKSVPKNYRPVALTSHLIKLFEKILRNKIVKFLEDNNLMNNNQHGFRRFRSCLSQLLEHYDLLLNVLQTNQNADVIYLDFAKAFDVVDHHILLRKLKRLGITGKVGKWIHNFLTNRTQYVTVEGQTSSEAPVTSGVPQGSVLGPVLFLIMISDIDENIINSIIKTFADDTKVLQKVCSAEDGKKLQDSLEIIYAWARKNNMKFNSTKFNLLRYGPDNELQQSISYKNPDGEEIVATDHTKDLGILMSADTTFTEHITTKATQCRKLVYWILRVFKTRRREPLLKLFTTLVLPRIDYCSQLIFPYKQMEWKALEQAQRTLTSKISDIKELNYWQRLEALKMYSVQRRFERYSIIYTYKILENLAPNFTVNRVESRFSERRGRQCVIPPILSHRCPSIVRNAREASFPIRGPRLFNSLPKHLRNISGVSVDSFKRRLDKFLATVPDQPTVDGYYGMRAANSNSLIDMIPLLNAVNPVEVENP